MRIAVRNLDLATWKTRNFVFFIAIVAMNFTLMRPAPADLIFLVVLAMSLVVNQAIRLPFLFFFGLLLSWELAMFFSSVPHIADPEVQSELIGKGAVPILAVTACYVTMSWGERNYHAFFKVYVAACTVSAILGIVGFAAKIDLLTWDNRARALFSDPNMFGSFMIPAVLACLYMLHFRVGSRVLVAGAFSVIVLGIILSFSRAATVAFLICLFAYLLFLHRLRLGRLVPVILAVAAVGIVLLGVAYLSSSDFSEKLLARLSVAQSYDLGREGRYGRYLLVLPMILDNPWGLGVLQLTKIFPEPIHNIFLGSFINYGWIGGFTWLTIVVSSIVLSVENYRRTRHPIAIMLLISFLGLVMCATLHEGEHWRHLWLFMGLVWGFSPANFRPPSVRQERPGNLAHLGDPASRSGRRRSVGVFAFQETQRRHQDDVEVEQDRPVLDVEQVVLDAALDLLFGVGLAAPAVDLRPAGDARLHAVAREVAVDDLVVELVRRLRLNRVRARPDERKVALEDDVEELRQFVEAGLADETPDAGHARVALGDELRRVGVGVAGIHRAELVDVDQLVVEAVALLLEEHRSLAVELDGERDSRHDRRSEQQDQTAGDPVEQPLGDVCPSR